MNLLRMKLKNFRGYKKADIRFDDQMTTIIGKNDIGKSTIVDALEIFFNNSTVKLDTDDAYINGDPKDVEITCEFSNIPKKIIIDESQTTNLRDEYLVTENGNLAIKKLYDLSGKNPKTKVYALANYPDNPELKDILYATRQKLKTTVKKLDPLYQEGVNFNINASLRAAIRKSCNITTYSTKEIDLAKVEGKLLLPKLEKYLPVFALFQSDRPSTDSDSEVQDPMHAATKESLANASEELEAIQKKVKAEVSQVAEHTIDKLSEMDPEIAKGLKPVFSTTPNWSSLFKFQIEDEKGIPLNKRGSGVRRLVLLNFFRAKSDLTDLQRNNIIYAIEEPETAQHPDNQRLIMKSLLELASKANCQIIITTHLAETAKMAPKSGVRLIKHNRKNRPEIFEDDMALTEAAKEVGLIPNFANTKIIVYVEGPNDINFLEGITKKLNQEFPDKYINFSTCDKLLMVPLGGGTLEHWVNRKYLNNLALASLYLFDKDEHGSHQKDADKVRNKNGCFWAGITDKREMENYISPSAIKRFYANKYDVKIPDLGDETDVPKTVAGSFECPKNSETIKKELNTKVVDEMTVNEFFANDNTNFMQEIISKINNHINRC